MRRRVRLQPIGVFVFFGRGRYAKEVWSVQRACAVPEYSYSRARTLQNTRFLIEVTKRKGGDEVGVPSDTPWHPRLLLWVVCKCISVIMHL